MDKKQIENQAKYWRLSANHDYDTMISLFNSKRYSDTLFYGHIVLEKLLKALIVINNEISAPMLHNLPMLAKSLNLNFYKVCNRTYTINYLNKIKSLYNNLC